MNLLKKTYLVLTCILLGMVGNLQAETLVGYPIHPENTQISLLTCSPGEQIYELFGHTAIRIEDPTSNIDFVVNYGLFDFNQDNFIYRFVRGKTDYMVGVSYTRSFLEGYKERGSSVTQSVLNLTTQEKTDLLNRLDENLKPENREYRYNFIYDNCATRPYQLIVSAYDYKITHLQQFNNITYRDIINKYVPVGSPLNTGINLIIGSQADKKITTKESVSFPMYTMDVLNQTHYITCDGSTKPVVLTQEVMHRAPHKEFQVSDLTFYSWIIIPLILALICVAYTFKKKRYLPYLTQIILFASGIIGIIISYLWFCSHHPLVNNNINFLWCNPLNLILAILLFIRRKPVVRTIKIILSTISMILCIIFLIALIANIQTTTPQIFSIWVLILIINTTIVHTYQSKFKTLRLKR